MEDKDKLLSVLNGFSRLKERVEKRSQYLVLFYSATSSLPQYVKEINMDPLGHVTFNTTVDISKAQQFTELEVLHFGFKEKLKKLTELFENHNSFVLAKLDIELNIVQTDWEEVYQSSTNIERKLWDKIEQADLDLKFEKDVDKKELIRLRKEAYLEILDSL